MKIIMLAGSGRSTAFVYNALRSDFEIDKILITDPPSKTKMIRRRIKNLGFGYVINQLFFQVFVIKFLELITASKIEKRRKELTLCSTRIPKEIIVNVGSVNSERTLEIIEELNPDVIIVNGTSIISKEVLESTTAIFINTHVGITPQYRGVHGGYWSLRNNDAENFGVTIHIVDKGIDTGDIIYQDTCSVTKKDNFLTYPLYQYALAIPLLKKTLEDIKMNKLKVYKKENVESKLYYHPTFTSYLWGRIRYGVK